VAAHNAASGSVVVMKPDTGDILAMASYPTFDPNIPVERGEDPEAAHEPRLQRPLRARFGVQSSYATRRRSKPPTCGRKARSTATAASSPRHTDDSRFSRRHVGGPGMATAFAKSSNIGAIQVGLKVGQVNMHDYMLRFGFGQKTGLPLPGESPGKVYRLERWGKTSLASVSMGQEVSVTTVQLAQAACVIASGGMLVKPRLVLKRGDRRAGGGPGARPQAGERHHHAPDDGRRGAGGHRQPRPAGRLFQRRQDRLGADLRLRSKHYTHTYNGSYMGFAPSPIRRSWWW
jgi:cell division protein FtsI (penicillin-binding protein 3)